MRRPLCLIFLLATGCLRSVPIEGARCPCPAGYVCCSATQTCAAEGTTCGATDDAGMPVTPMPGEPDGGVPLPPEADLPGPTPFARLTPREMRNTLRDLLAIPAYDPSLFLPDWGYRDIEFTRGLGGITSDTDAYKLMVLTQKAAADAVKDLTSLLPCAPVPITQPEQEACVREFVTRFGLRAYRRPIDVAERDALLAVYRVVRTEGGADFTGAIRLVVEAMLQSPFFLYRWEGGGPTVREGTLVRFTPYEMASRLSYGLWATLPDEALFGAAARNELQTPEQIEAQARRMLADPRAREVITDFYVQTLGAVDLHETAKESSFNFTPALARSMLEETASFTSALLVGPGSRGRLQDLLTSTATVVDGPLAKIYGLTNPPGIGTAPVMLDATQRAGLLTQATFLAANGTGEGTDIARRGKHVLERFLCRRLPPIDDIGIIPPLPEHDPALTYRENFERITNHACAAACHDIYPLGWAFEHYDTVGTYRTREPGLARDINASGSIMLPSGKLEWKTAVELVHKLPALPEVRDCVPRQWLRYLARRREGPGDARSLMLAGQAFTRSSHDIREAIVALLKSRVFTHRTPSPGEVLP